MSKIKTHQKFKENQLSQFKELLNSLRIDLTTDDQLKIKYDRTERLERASWYESEIARLEAELKEPLKARFDQIVSTLSNCNSLVIHKYEALNRQFSDEVFWLNDIDPKQNVISMLNKFAGLGHKPNGLADRFLEDDTVDMRGLLFSMSAAFPHDYDEFTQLKQQRSPMFFYVIIHAYRRWGTDVFSTPEENLMAEYTKPLVEFYFIGELTVVLDGDLNVVEVQRREEEPGSYPPMPNISSMGAPLRSLYRRHPQGTNLRNWKS